MRWIYVRSTLERRSYINSTHSTPILHNFALNFGVDLTYLELNFSVDLTYLAMNFSVDFIFLALLLAYVNYITWIQRFQHQSYIFCVEFWLRSYKFKVEFFEFHFRPLYDFKSFSSFFSKSQFFHCFDPDNLQVRKAKSAKKPLFSALL